jgi:hypothetical protein
MEQWFKMNQARRWQTKANITARINLHANNSDGSYERHAGTWLALRAVTPSSAVSAPLSIAWFFGSRYQDAVWQAVWNINVRY